MAHKLDKNIRFTSSASPAEYSFVCGNGTTVLCVGIVVAGATERAGGAPTYDGTELTQADQTRKYATDPETSCELWYLLEPDIGENFTLSIPNTGTANLYVQISSYKAGDGYTSVLDVANGATGISSNSTVSVTTTANGDIIVAVMGNGRTSVPTACSGTSLNMTDNGEFTDNNQYYIQSTSGAMAMSWTIAADDWCVCTVAFKRESVNPPVQAAYPVRLVPFAYSADIAYMLEFGNMYIRFFYDKEPLLDRAGDIIEIDTPYSYEHLKELQIEQMADVMWIVHGKYPSMKLSRETAYRFILEEIEFKNGPFLLRNDLIDPENLNSSSMICSVTAIDATGTLICSEGYFEDEHIGSLFKLTQRRAINESSGKFKKGQGTLPYIFVPAIDVKGTWTFTSHSSWAGTIKIERSENSGPWDVFRIYESEKDSNVQQAFTEDADNVQYRVSVTAFTSGSIRAEITIDTGTQDGIVRVLSIVNSNIANIVVITKLASSKDTTRRWAEGAWNYKRGFPSTITFFEGRCIYGGTYYDPQAIWFSGSDKYEDFEEDVKDGDSFSLALSGQNRIQWLNGIESLGVGTVGGEWRVMSTKLDQPLTPTNTSVKEQTFFGSSAIQSIKAEEAILFVDAVGRKVREFAFVGGADQKFKSPDMNSLAEHITLSGIVSIAFQRNPDPILWCCLGNGKLIGLVYNRSEDVIAWFNCPTDGFVESVAIIPGADEDEVWIAGVRKIGDIDIEFIEVMSQRYYGESLEDAFFVDCGVTLTSQSPVNVIPYLDHLVGATVSVLADGVVYEGLEVSDEGEVTLPEGVLVSKVHVGLPYSYKLEPMRLDTNIAAETTKGSIKKIAEIVISFLNSLGVKYGSSDAEQFDVGIEETDPPATYTGDKVLAFDGGFNTEDPIIITGDKPLPCTIRAIVARTEKTGR